jgi:hypothetical protein
MLEFNTNKCADYNSFIIELNALDSLIQSSDSSTDTDKIKEWIKNNWSYLQKGSTEASKELRDFQAHLQTIAQNDTHSAAKRILETFTNCLTNRSFFEIAPQDILSHTFPFLSESDRVALIQSNISPKTNSMVENALIEEINRGVPVKDLGLQDETLNPFIEKHKELIEHLNVEGLPKYKAVAFALFCPNLIRLILARYSIHLQSLQKILNRAKPNQLKHLDLSFNNIEDDGVRALAESPNLRNLEYLNLTCCFILVDGARALAASKNFELVLHLNLSNNNIKDDGARALAASKNFKLLQSLNLSANHIGVDGARALAESENFKRVQHLDLSNNNIKGDGARALAASKNFELVQHLDLTGNKIKAYGTRALAASKNFRRLQHLDLCSNNINADGARALAASPNLQQLQHLDLCSNNITDDEVRVLAASPNLKHLQYLNLCFNNIGPDGARALAASPNLKELQYLNLMHNSIKDDGARALAASKNFTSLKILYLFSNYISNEEQNRIEDNLNKKKSLENTVNLFINLSPCLNDNIAGHRQGIKF